MKLSKARVRSKVHARPRIDFENHTLTSFAGLVVYQEFFAKLDLKARLRRCFRELSADKIFERGVVFLQLIVHLLLGFRELRQCDWYRDDPLVKRVLGLDVLPDASTLSRLLKEVPASSVKKLRGLLRDLVLERLQRLAFPRVTLDFDGSVQSTTRRAQGAAVGFNKKKKGARSYYPLFCVVGQTGQVLDFLHRSGNVHDSHGAREFVLACVDAVRRVLPGAVIEVRMDSAFFSDEIIRELQWQGVEFTVSVPFERFAQLKRQVQQRRRWYRLNAESAYFESAWKPKSWDRRYRFLFVRTRVKKQHKGPIQLDLFAPVDHQYEYKVIITNKTVRAQSVVGYHEGRGSQEGVFGELKSHCHIDYVPVRRLHGNQTYLLAGLLAYNLTRELQMQSQSPSRRTTRRRTPLWAFERIDTMRKTFIQRAGRLTRPRNVLTLTISANHHIKLRFRAILNALQITG